MKRYDLRELHSCIFNDYIYCDQLCTTACEVHPIHKGLTQSQKKIEEVVQSTGHQISIDEVLNEKKEIRRKES